MSVDLLETSIEPLLKCFNVLIPLVSTPSILA